MKKYCFILAIGLFLSNAACAEENDPKSAILSEIASDPVALAVMLSKLAKNMPQIVSKSARDGKIVAMLQRFIALELLAEKCLENHKLEEGKYEILRKVLNVFKKAYCWAMEELTNP